MVSRKEHFDCGCHFFEGEPDGDGPLEPVYVMDLKDAVMLINKIFSLNLESRGHGTLRSFENELARCIAFKAPNFLCPNVFQR